MLVSLFHLGFFEFSCVEFFVKFMFAFLISAGFSCLRSFVVLIFFGMRARTGVRRELAARVDMNVLRWLGHVERMDNERLLKKVMNAKVDGRSARGRPRFGWVDGVKRALNDRRMDVREASEHARNRNEWRIIVMQF